MGETRKLAAICLRMSSATVGSPASMRSGRSRGCGRCVPTSSTRPVDALRCAIEVERNAGVPEDRRKTLQIAVGRRLALAVVRSRDPSSHSRGQRRCRRATSRTRCRAVQPSAELPAAGPGVLPRRSPRHLPRRGPHHPAPPTAPDSSPSPSAGHGGCATTRRSAGLRPYSLATSRRRVHRGLGDGARWA